MTGTFISHTVAAIVILPVRHLRSTPFTEANGPTKIAASVGQAIGHAELLVFAGVVMASSAMSLPVSSFPNANSFAVKNGETGRNLLKVSDFLSTGVIIGLLLLAEGQTVLFLTASLFGL